MARAVVGILLMAALSPALPASAAPVQVAAQVLNWTANDDITHYRSAPTQAVAGQTTIIWENSAATGNTTGMPHTLTFDTTTPGYNTDVNLNILANPFDANNGRHEATVTLTPGKYRYFCSIPGHSSMVGEFVVTPGGPDTTPPAVSAAVTGTRNSDGHYVGSATVTVTATDGESGVEKVEYQIDDTSFQPYTAPVQVTAVGDHAVQYRATDKAGNTSAVGSVQFRVVAPPGDTTPPTVSAVVSGNRDANGNYVEYAMVTLTATDAESGVRSIEYSLDGGAWTAYSEPVMVNARGAHMLHYRATDNAGNIAPEGMAHFTVVDPPVQDTTPPTVSAAVAGDRDANGNYLGTATATVTATDTQSGVDKVEYSLDGAAFTAYTAPVVVRALGAHTVRYRATDVAGNTSPEGTASFTVVAPPVQDTTPPTVSTALSGSRDASGNYLDSATVTVTATDTQSGVRTVEYALDGGAWTAYTAPVRVGSRGAHTVLARATDVAGNVSTPVSASFTVVEPGSDACPDSDTRATVIIGGDDTRIANVDTGTGCTINDLIDERGQYLDHGTFVRHVESVTDPLVTRGMLSRRDQGAIVRTAARSEIGK
jgi:plastocyanin